VLPVLTLPVTTGHINFTVNLSLIHIQINNNSNNNNVFIQSHTYIIILPVTVFAISFHIISHFFPISNVVYFYPISSAHIIVARITYFIRGYFFIFFFKFHISLVMIFLVCFILQGNQYLFYSIKYHKIINIPSCSVSAVGALMADPISTGYKKQQSNFIKSQTCR
jgi:hypothetical protein